MIIQCCFSAKEVNMLTTTPSQIIFPSLKRIEIHNYSLYKQDIDYEFRDGINLIIGGNGMGKTTFVNILKYALIGAYRSHTRFERTYQDRRIIRRQPLHEAFFRNRMKLRGLNKDAYVKLSFSIGDQQIEVVRSLYEHQIMELKLVSNGELGIISGKSIPQSKYDQLIRSMKEDSSENISIKKTSNNNREQLKEISESLQAQYEAVVCQAANIESFDAFIFFVINIFIFDEDRSTIFWEDKTSSELTVQEYLTAYLLSDLSTQLENYSFEAKYLDSKIRHRSEDRKPLQKLLNDFDISKDKSGMRVSDLLNLRDKYDKNISEIDIDRQNLDIEIKNLKNKEETLLLNLTDVKEKLEKGMSDRMNDIFGNLHPEYSLFLRFIRDRSICPLCKETIDKSLTDKQLNMESCILCDSKLKEETIYDPKLINPLIDKKMRLQKDLELLIDQRSNKENKLRDLDSKLDKMKAKLIEVNQQIRIRERESIKDKSIGEANDYNLVLKRIAEIEQEIGRLKLNRDAIQEKLNILNKQLYQKRVDFTQRLSFAFTKYAELFLTRKCLLKYDKSIYNPSYKCYIPIIEDIPRYSKDELSESQAFFIEQSFRLSFLDNFYRFPTFFIFETPDSSLDIAFSKRAADTLLSFLDRPNCLIITFNYGNSDFLSHIAERLPKDRITVLDMMQFGYQSDVQMNNNELTKARDHFMELL